MSDSNFYFKPNSETENQCSDGSVLTLQQKCAPCFSIPVFLSPSPFLLLSFRTLMFKFKPSWHLFFLPLFLQRDPQGNLQPRARASQLPGFYRSGNECIIPVNASLSVLIVCSILGKAPTQDLPKSPSTYPLLALKFFYQVSCNCLREKNFNYIRTLICTIFMMNLV